MKLKPVLLAVALAGVSLPAQAATTVGVDPDNNAGSANCYPFGCGGSAGFSFYQQVYDASAFSGPIRIDTVGFARDAAFPGVMDTNSYTVRFYVTDKSTATLTGSIIGNRGSLLSDFGSYALSGQVPQALTLQGNGFTYDPSQGNLLMEVQLGSPSFYALYGGQTPGYFSADPRGTVTASVTSFGFVSKAGLVTTFAAVPEPGSWAMMLGGFGAMGAVVRRRRGPAALSA